MPSLARMKLWLAASRAVAALGGRHGPTQAALASKRASPAAQRGQYSVASTAWPVQHGPVALLPLPAERKTGTPGSRFPPHSRLDRTQPARSLVPPQGAPVFKPAHLSSLCVTFVEWLTSPPCSPVDGAAWMGYLPCLPGLWRLSRCSTACGAFAHQFALLCLLLPALL